MTISSTTNKVTAQGNGLTTQFSYDFLIPTQAVLQVIYTDADGADTVIPTSAYTVTGIGDDDGGAVTYPLVGSPIATGTYLTIVRDLPLKQLVTVANQGNFYPTAVEDALDYLMMAIQQVNEIFERALVTPITDPSAPLPLPTAAERANQLLGFDADGNPIVAQPSSALVSTAMQPVVSAATLALGRTAFGLGTMSTEGIGAGLEDDGAGLVRVNSDFVPIVINSAVVAGYHQTQVKATGALTFTHPAADTLWNGFGYWLYTGASACTLAIDAGDNFDGQVSGASIGIPANSVAWISTDGAASGIWYVRWQPYTLPFGVEGNAGAVSGISIANNSGTPNTQLDVSTLAVGVTNSSGRNMVLASLSATINAINVGVVNGLDTGVLAANTWYYVWAIGGASLTGTILSGYLLSASSTAPTLPTGYTFKRRIGAVRTNGSIQFYRTVQKGNRVQYASGTNMRLMTSGVSGSISVPTWTSVSVSSYVPPTAASIRCNLNASINGVGDGAMVAPNNTYGAITSTTNPPYISSYNANTYTRQQSVQAEMVLETTNIYYASSVAAVQLYCSGWVDNI